MYRIHKSFFTREIPFTCRCDGGGKHEFHDPKYNKEREEVTERVHDAIEAAFSKPGTSTSQNKQMAATASSASATGMVANPVVTDKLNQVTIGHYDV